MIGLTSAEPTSTDRTGLWARAHISKDSERIEGNVYHDLNRNKETWLETGKRRTKVWAHISDAAMLPKKLGLDRETVGL